MSGRGELLTGVHLDKSQVLGEGAFGVVYRGRLGDAGVAIKTIKANSPEQAAELEATLLEEAAVWAAVQHPNVVQFYGVHKDAEGGLYLVSELMDGSVEGLLHEDGERVADGEEAVLTERQQLTMCLHVACALRRLHQLKILHSDLAARNVLYKRTGGGDLVFKVTDFGLATVGSGRAADGSSASASRSYQLVSREQVPVRWCAPEVLKRQLYSAEADVWSLGVYIWEVFALGELPYGLHMTNAEIYRQITPAKSTFRLEMPEECTQEAYDLMMSCWKFGRKARITLPAIEDQLRTMRDRLAPDVNVTPVASPSPVPSRAAAPPPAQASPALQQRELEASPMRSRRRSMSNMSPEAIASSAKDFFEKGEGARQSGKGSVALEFYREGADLGHPGAQRALGQYYLNGDYIKKNEGLALDLFRKAAVQGEGQAMVAMGNAYENGIGDLVKSLGTALEWYQKACEVGTGEAFFLVARFYWRGRGVERDLQKVFDTALAGVDVEGGTDCFDILGEFYFRGLLVGEDEPKALEFIKKGIAAGSQRCEARHAFFRFFGHCGVQQDKPAALVDLQRLAKEGIEVAMVCYGAILVDGEDAPKKINTGLTLIEKAAELDDLDALILLGGWYCEGIHVKVHSMKGVEMLKKAAAFSLPAAYLKLGNHYERKKSMDEALKWWKMGMDTNAEACYKVGAHIVLNSPVTSDLSEGMGILAKSVEMGHAEGIQLLGPMYCKGVGVPKDLKRGAMWLQKGAEMGDASNFEQLGLTLTEEDMEDKELIELGINSLKESIKAQHEPSIKRMGMLYLKGRFVEQNDEAAKKYLSFVGEKGDEEAQFALGELSDKIGEPRQAVKWYEKAARQKNLEAAFRLAEHVENGNGATVNLHTAVAWYSRVDTPESHYRQAIILMSGDARVPVDLNKATANLKRASAQGHLEATYRLGLHARDGVGMRVDKDEAIRLFTAASNEGHAGAFCELGQCYYDGYGPLKKDRKVALSCFETAAAAGHAPAEQILRDRKAAWKKIKR